MSQKKKMQMEELEIGGAIYPTHLTAKFRKRQRWVKPDEKKVVAVIPGTVREVFISKGDVVEAGRPLLILEAMKMRNEVVAPCGGKVISVNVVEDEHVPKEHLLVELD